MDHDENEFTTENNDLQQMVYCDPEEIIQMKVSKKLRELGDFLRNGQFMTERGNPRTNLINRGDGCTYCIPRASADRLFTLLEDCRREKRVLHFSERQETDSVDKSGIMIDFDVTQKVKNRVITVNNLTTFLSYTAATLNRMIDFSSCAKDGQFTFNVFVTTKPEIVELDSKADSLLYRDGFHILIPEIQISKAAKIHLINELVNKNYVKSAFGRLPLATAPEKMLDRNSAAVPVMFFGHSKPGKPAYELSHVFEITLDVEDPEMLPHPVHMDAKSYLDGTINLTYELSLSYSLESIGNQPVWLQKVPHEVRPELLVRLTVHRREEQSNEFADILQEDTDLALSSIDDPVIKQLRSLLEILDISYATEYDKWFKVLCAIANTGKGNSYKALAAWFSRRCPEKWDPVAFEAKWAEACKGTSGGAPITKQSIIYWARESSPNRFKEVEASNHEALLYNFAHANEGRVEHSMVAYLLHLMIGDKFVVDVDYSESPQGKYVWYEFVSNTQSMIPGQVFKWRKEVNPDNIHIYIADKLPLIYNAVLRRIKDRRAEIDDKGLAEHYALVEKTLNAYKSKLSNDRFQAGVISQARYRFRRRGFVKELDSYKDVLGVGNGVLKIGAAPELIKGFHEYCISKFTEINYIPFSPQNNCIAVLLKAFRDIFVEPDVCEFMLLYGSTWLDGEESACIMVFLVGGGQNGKTFFVKMLHNAIGMQYVRPLKMELITGPSEKANEANSALMELKGLRGGYFDESGVRPRINIARFKAIVNPGFQSGRQLFSRQDYFMPTANLISLSNYEPEFDTTDHGTWRRVYFYRNKVKFTENPKPDDPYEKKEDARFIHVYTNSVFYREAMLSIMTEYYRKLTVVYGGDIKKVPVPTIKKETAAFRNTQDVVDKFINEMIVKSPTAQPISIYDLGARYDEWYRLHISRTTVDEPKVIQDKLSNSRLNPYLKMINGTKMLEGFRCKSKREDPILEGEVSMNGQEVPEPDVPSIF